MACPIPLRIINPKYKKIAFDSDDDLYSYESHEDFYIDVPCGNCYHCLKSYKTQWNLRLQHEFKYMTPEQRANSYFITLTFSNSYLPHERPTKDLVSPLIRKFLERVRKKYKCSPRHWFVSEYGDNTERYHLHGILFDSPFPIYQLQKLWKYGYVSHTRLNPKRITYVTTYVNKLLKGLLQDPTKKQHVFCSPGIGKKFTEQPINIAYSHMDDTPVPFIYYNNRPFAMPRYYRGKFFSDDEREIMTQSYFHFQSEDVIPDPPYILGTRQYDDYTEYLSACEQLKRKYKLLYGKSKSKSVESTT